MRLGVFGGTFNPIHFGHLRAAEEVRQRLSLDEVCFLPSASPPLKSSDIASVEQRFLMASMAVAANEHFRISDLECRRPQKSYTVDTARALQAEYPGAELYFILGVDAFYDLPNWHEPEELVGLIDFCVIGRPPVRFAELAGSPFIDVPHGYLEALDSGERVEVTAALSNGKHAVLLGIPLMDISSTFIRNEVAAGRSIKYLLPERVESFIMSHGLYRGER